MLGGMIRYEVRGPVAWLTLDRPEKLNAMTRGFFTELRETRRAPRPTATRRPRRSSSTAPASASRSAATSRASASSAEPVTAAPTCRRRSRAFRAVEELSKPTIAAVHGHALGGGCELTMVCDLVVADETARFGTPEAGGRALPRPRRRPRPRATSRLHALKYMIFTGAPLDAQQALAAGLVNEVVPAGEHLAEAEEWAATIAQKAPLALAAAKAFLSARRAGSALPHVVDAVAMLQGSDDFAEGIAAFAERRPPRFEGR